MHLIYFRLQRKLIQLSLVLWPTCSFLRRWFRHVQIKISNESIQTRKNIDRYFKENLSNKEWKIYKQQRSRSRSQCRQDLIIGLINDWNCGVIIEVGATDGLLLSNSVMLEKYLGWECILVEPCRSWHDLLKLNRTSSKLIFEAAFHSPNLSLQFTETEFAELSGLTGSLPIDYWSIERENSFNYAVNTTTLDSICDNFEINGKFLAITVDIEGGELEALRGFTKNLSLASLMVIENNGNAQVIFELDEILFNQGYVRLEWPFDSFDSWYLRKDLLASSSILIRLFRSGELNLKPTTAL